MDKLVKGFRLVTVVLMVLALVVSGAGTAERLFTQQSDVEESSAKSATLDRTPDPDDPSHEMATDGNPWTEQPAYWQTATLSVGTGQYRLGMRFAAEQSIKVDLHHPRFVRHTCETVSLVCPSVGQRFTLVGSKPSGTS